MPGLRRRRRHVELKRESRTTRLVGRHARSADRVHPTRPARRMLQARHTYTLEHFGTRVWNYQQQIRMLRLSAPQRLGLGLRVSSLQAHGRVGWMEKNHYPRVGLKRTSSRSGCPKGGSRDHVRRMLHTYILGVFASPPPPSPGAKGHFTGGTASPRIPLPLPAGVVNHLELEAKGRHGLEPVRVVAERLPPRHLLHPLSPGN